MIRTIFKNLSNSFYYNLSGTWKIRAVPGLLEVMKQPLRTKPCGDLFIKVGNGNERKAR